MQPRSRQTKVTRGRGSTNKRESGEPGGGQGRRDVVRGSRVYPMSGPLPRGKAVIRGEAEWGQGERGAAGYEDSGESGLGGTYSFTSRRTSRKPASSRERASARQNPQIVSHEIPRRKWTAFFNDFNRLHAGWFVEVDVGEPRKGTLVEVQRLPFEGITADIKPRARDTVSVISELGPNRHLTHLIPHTKEVHLIEEPQLQIQIVDADGDVTIVTFQQPRRRSERLLPPPR